MHFQIASGSLISAEADLVAIGCFQKEPLDGQKKSHPVLERADGGSELDRLFDGEISELIAKENFTGSEGKTRLIFAAGKIPARYILLVGLGKKKELSVGGLKRIGAVLAKQAQEVKAASLSLVVQKDAIANFSVAARMQALVEGLILGSYRFDRYREASARTKLTLEKVVVISNAPRAQLEKAIIRGQAIAEATCFTRDLSNTPPNDLTPMALAKIAENVAKQERLTITVWGKKELQDQKMNAFLAVAQGSVEPPVLIHLNYKPKKAKYRIALVGKAVTFDSGGISIKPSRNMHEMKSDMSGGAVVLATMLAIAQLKPDVAVDAYIPSSENMPDAKAFKPGDIITARNGKTIEIISTDAEGRMLLADTLSYVTDGKPDYVIDLATLTGGAVYALGEIYAAVLGNDQRLIDRLLSASHDAGESVWQLPLEKRYLSGLTKGPADLVNSGGGMAQTITATLFLSQFVGQTKWAHFDIAACAWTNEGSELCPKGGTGSMVATLVEFLSGF
ncbi:MAG: leucyl aminopeptidase [Deltaproteobacteria bacterium]|nr:leucyl aminopeptidase [Deltaproteobacteria bacterium]